MATTNPYDRRRGPRERGLAMANTGFKSLSDGFTAGPRESPLAFADLEAMVYSAERRGREAAQEDGIHAANEREQLARREAWQEGRVAGFDDGHEALLTQIDERHGATVRRVLSDCRIVLKSRANGDASKSQLETALKRAADLLAVLIDSHHARFGELPF